MIRRWQAKPIGRLAGRLVYSVCIVLIFVQAAVAWPTAIQISQINQAEFSAVAGWLKQNVPADQVIMAVMDVITGFWVDRVRAGAGRLVAADEVREQDDDDHGHHECENDDGDQLTRSLDQGVVLVGHAWLLALAAMRSGSVDRLLVDGLEAHAGRAREAFKYSLWRRPDRGEPLISFAFRPAPQGRANQKGLPFALALAAGGSFAAATKRP